MQVQDQIVDIQGFQKVYQNLFKPMDIAISGADYSLMEKEWN